MHKQQHMFEVNRAWAPRCILGRGGHVDGVVNVNIQQVEREETELGERKNMLKSRKGCGIYRDTLSRDARDRYVDKIGTINGLDQYENPNKEWSTDDELLPHFCITDIFGYLVCFVSAYTSEQFRSYKSLESHVQFTNGWVKELQIIKPANSIQ